MRHHATPGFGGHAALVQAFRLRSQNKPSSTRDTNQPPASACSANFLPDFRNGLIREVSRPCLGQPPAKEHLQISVYSFLVAELREEISNLLFIVSRQRSNFSFDFLNAHAVNMSLSRGKSIRNRRQEQDKLSQTLV